MRPIGLATGIALAIIVLIANVGAARAQAAGALKDQLSGTWSFVSSTSERDDGSNTWGPDAKGQLVFLPNGRFSFQLMRGDRPKYKSNTRMRGSLIENQATSRGSLSYFGTYTVNDSDRSLTYNVEMSSFPNYNGTTLKRHIVSISDDEFRYQNPAPVRGTTPTTLVWKRVK